MSSSVTGNSGKEVRDKEEVVSDEEERFLLSDWWSAQPDVCQEGSNDVADVCQESSTGGADVSSRDRVLQEQRKSAMPHGIVKERVMMASTSEYISPNHSKPPS